MKFIKEWREYKKPKSDYYTKRINISKLELGDICALLNIKEIPKFISSGRFGNAYKIGDKVLKISTDNREAKSVSTIINSGFDNDSIVKYHSINRYKLKHQFVYIIIMDWVESISEYLKKYKDSNLYKDFISDCCEAIYNNWKEIKSKDFLREIINNWGWISEDFWIDRFWNLVNNLRETNYQDLHLDNLGIKKGELVLFDYCDTDKVRKFDEPSIISHK